MSTNRAYPRVFFIDLNIEQKRWKLIVNTHKKHKTLKSVVEALDEIEVCLKPMCEHEENWHFSKTGIILKQSFLNVKSVTVYLARIENILMNGRMANEIILLRTIQGQNLVREIKRVAIQEIKTTSLEDSYKALRSMFIRKFESNLAQEESKQIKLDLVRCELKNGKITWLCDKHLKETCARILTENTDNGEYNQNDMNEIFLKELQNMKGLYENY
jgi:hypothetical protein